MKIIHTSDWHLGRRLGRVDRTQDLCRGVQQVADLCERENAGVLLICGDIFEQGRADVLRYWIDQLNQVFGSFLRRGGTILAITGNHDNENFAQMLRQAMLLAAPAPADVGQAIAPGRFYLFTDTTLFHLLDGDGTKVQFIAMPSPTHSRYLNAAQMQSYQGAAERNRALKAAYLAKLQEILSNPKFDSSCPTVLAAHVLINGVEIRNGYRLIESEGSLIRAEELPTQLAYVALGDVHKPQTLLNLEHVRYCGSIDRMDLGEAGEEKGVVTFEIGPQGRKQRPRWVPIEATPIHFIEIDDPAAEVPQLAVKYPDHERALVKLMVRYRAGRDHLNDLLAELDRIFPRCYERDWQEISGGNNNGDRAAAGNSHELQTLRKTVMGYLDTQLESDADRDDILRLADGLIAKHEHQ